MFYEKIFFRLVFYFHHLYCCKNQAMVYSGFLNINKTINYGYDWWSFTLHVIGFQIKYAIIASFFITYFKHTKL
jgi:hypothetical protein